MYVLVVGNPRNPRFALKSPRCRLIQGWGLFLCPREKGSFRHPRIWENSGGEGLAHVNGWVAQNRDDLLMLKIS